MREQSEPNLAEPLRQQSLLRRPVHPDGDISISAQQVVVAIAQHEFEVDPRLFLAERDRISGSTSAPMISLAVIRTVPPVSLRAPSAFRWRPAAAAAIASADATSVIAAAVG